GRALRRVRRRFAARRRAGLDGPGLPPPAERRQGEADAGPGQAHPELLARREARPGPGRRLQDARAEGRRGPGRTQAGSYRDRVLVATRPLRDERGRSPSGYLGRPLVAAIRWRKPFYGGNHVKRTLRPPCVQVTKRASEWMSRLAVQL